MGMKNFIYQDLVKFFFYNSTGEFIAKNIKKKMFIEFMRFCGENKLQAMMIKQKSDYIT